MPAITISRGGGWADRFRGYAILVDGQSHGEIRPKQTRSIEVAHGSHHVQLRAGVLAGSPVLRVHVDERGTSLACGSNKRLHLALVQMGRPDTWIWLRPAAP
ncbi:hypothetical protein D3273_12985 [Lichenibacterium minor]|jgi:hypothetical protein|uniref:Uncharacterized protein n=1 Tax=Lichenibacterium minor TaxID=2316528 RepID=A0A4Q2U4Q9_9HYPH|nr:hypothetical protein [Lichenibacterium minor]RYC31549.1 hypothetical protein D3273_12985 [Lichenibacterium minor]